jgi:hypothetical protein
MCAGVKAGKSVCKVTQGPKPYEGGAFAGR